MTDVANLNPNRCEVCRWWNDPARLVMEFGSYRCGSCQRRSPIILALKDDKTAAWPSTWSSQWCGDFAEYPNPSHWDE